MPAKRAVIHPEYQPLTITHNEQVKRLAQASAILLKGEARRLQPPATQSKVAIDQEFIHNPPLIQGDAKIS